MNIFDAREESNVTVWVWVWLSLGRIMRKTSPTLYVVLHFDVLKKLNHFPGFIMLFLSNFSDGIA